MPYRILVIDDNAQLRGVLKKYLRNFLNCEVLTHPDGFSATKFLKTEKPVLDAIVLDVMMKCHGGSVADYLRSDPQYRDVILVFYSGLEKSQIDKAILEDDWFVHKSKGSLMEVIRLLSRELKKKKEAGPGAGSQALQDARSCAGGMRS